jgi:hypothetical protein
VLYRGATSQVSARRAAGRGTGGGEETSGSGEFVERLASEAAPVVSQVEARKIQFPGGEEGEKGREVRFKLGAGRR